LCKGKYLSDTISIQNGLKQWLPTCGTHNPWGYAVDRLGVRENNIGNGGKYQKKGVKIKTQKQSYEVFVYKDRLM
jgi:hypothetical protein